jgi:hypothetical protein
MHEATSDCQCDLQRQTIRPTESGNIWTCTACGRESEVRHILIEDALPRESFGQRFWRAFWEPLDADLDDCDNLLDQVCADRERVYRMTVRCVIAAVLLVVAGLFIGFALTH